MQEEKNGECSPHFFPQRYILKIFKYTEKLKESYSEHPYIHLTDSPVKVLLYLLHLASLHC